MLGVPYVARPSARNEAWTPPAPPAPEVIAQRQIRNEQDAAYQESLLVRPYATCDVNHRSQHALSSAAGLCSRVCYISCQEYHQRKQAAAVRFCMSGL